MLSDVGRTNGISTSNKRFNNNSKQPPQRPVIPCTCTLSNFNGFKKRQGCGLSLGKQSSDNAD